MINCMLKRNLNYIESTRTFAVFIEEDVHLARFCPIGYVKTRCWYYSSCGVQQYGGLMDSISHTVMAPAVQIVASSLEHGKRQPITRGLRVHD